MADEVKQGSSNSEQLAGRIWIQIEKQKRADSEQTTLEKCRSRVVACRCPSRVMIELIDAAV